MRGEVPTFKRCCFCIPLRRGLLGWGYFRLALNILSTIPLIYTALILGSAILRIPKLLVTLVIFSILIIIEAISSTVLIVACHKKSPKLLNVYYIYGIVELIVILASTAFISYVEIKNATSTWAEDSQESIIRSMVVQIASCFVQTFVAMYVLLLVRSELMKLREQRLEMQFVNNAAEGESHCVCTDNGLDTTVQCTDNGLDTTGQCTDNGHDTTVQCTDNGLDTTVECTDNGLDTTGQCTDNGHDTTVQCTDNPGRVVRGNYDKLV